jgi:flagellar basal body-associated protein FliL
VRAEDRSPTTRNSGRTTCGRRGHKRATIIIVVVVIIIIIIIIIVLYWFVFSHHRTAIGIVDIRIPLV